MADVERPTRRRGKMGGAARALALGLTIGGWASSQGLTAAASDLPAAVAAAGGLQECGFIVTMWGESAACEQQLDGAAVGCDKKSFSRRADRVQALVGSVPKEAGLGPVREAGSSEWRQVLDFGCVDGRDKLVVSLYDNLMRPLATCEVGETASIESSKAMVCEGAHGMHFKYTVEHTALLAEPIRPQRRAQLVTPTATPAPAAVGTTPAPVSPEIEPTPAAVEPTPAAVGPTPAPETPATEAPEPEPTEPPTAEATSAPVTPVTAEPTPRLTPAPNTPETPAPVTPDTAEPTPRRTPAPMTPPTPAPVTPATPAPVTAAPVTPETPEPTPAPVAAVVPETPAPVTLTPPTDAPQAPVAAPTPEPTVGTTDSPVAAPTPPPSTLPTSTPQAPPTAPPESPAPTALIAPPTERPTPRPTPSPVSTPEPATDSPVPPPSPVPFTPRSTTSPPTAVLTPMPVESPPSSPVPSTPQPTTSPRTAVTPMPAAAPPPVSSAVTPMPVAAPSPVSSTEPPADSPNAPPSTALPSTPQPSAAGPNAAAFTPMPVASPPPVVPAATTSQPTAAAATTSPMNPLPREQAAPSSSPTHSPPSPSAATPSAETTATPSPVVSTETVAPAAGATVTPATPAPSAAEGETPAPFSSPAPVATSSSSAEATLSPNTEEVCTEACVLDNLTPSSFSATYYDARCEGKDDSDLSGCNLSSTNSEWNNCRNCIINLESFEAENGVGSVEWPLCPCCVAETLLMDPQTDECIAEAGTAVTTPTPTMVGETTLNLRTEANDPDLLMMSFNSEDCTAFGIAVIPGTTPKVMEISRYTDADGLCNSNFDMLVGTECDLESYSWDYSSSSFEYMYTCSTTTSAGRRRLADGGSEEYPIESDAVLCNNGDHFVSLSSLDGGETGLVYATPDAENYDSVTDSQTALSGSDMCGESTDANVVTTLLLEEIEEDDGLSGLLGEADESSSEGDGLGYEIIIGIVCAVVLLMGCACFCCYRHRKGKESRAVHMRRNLGYTPDMEAKGEGNFGPTNKHVAITRGGGPQVTPEMLATTSYSQPSHPPTHQRAPSEAPSSIIEDNIANNYRPKTAAKSWKKRKEHKDLTKPVPQQHVIGGSPNSEELKAENSREGSRANSNTRSQASARSEQLSEHSLSQLQMANQTAAAQPNYGYTFEHVEEEGEEDDDDDDDARSAATGMSGPSKYAPSGYAPSNHQDGVTHDLMSQYEPSVYEADSQYDPSLYGRESEYGDESSSYSYNDGAGSRRGGYAGGGGGGGGGRGGRHMSGRASVADTAAMSHLGSVMEMDDGGSAYAPSESYVSSYVSSEDDDGRPARSIHPRGGPNDAQAMGGVPTDGGSSSNGGGSGGGYSRHNAHRSGRQPVASGRSGFGASSAGSSSRHSGARSGIEGGSRSYDDEDDESAVGRTAVSMDDLEYYSEDQNAGGMTSGRGAPLTDLEETHGGQRW